MEMTGIKLSSSSHALLEAMDIQINGTRPWDIQVHHPDFYQALNRLSSLQAGETYMDGKWDCEHLDQLFFQALHFSRYQKVYNPWRLAPILIKNLLLHHQTKWQSKKVAKQHYNLDNDLYQHMLGPSMAYTCAYWKNADTLDAAQYAKYDLVCRKLGLKAGDKVLELGCGWGSFSKYAAEKYGCEMTAVNISSEQIKFAKAQSQGLNTSFYLCDYRDMNHYNPNKIKFDHVVSIGMCEHVGAKNYKHLMKIARDNLKDDGLFLLHTIGKNISINYVDPWINQYIFPGGMLPTIKWLSRAAEGKFIIEDLHNFGNDYDKTLMAWHENFEAYWPEIKHKYDERFYRMWRYYLLSCAGAFRARDIQLWQFVLSPKGVLNGYRSIR